MRRAIPVAVLAGVTVGLALTSRAPEAGVTLRAAFVVFSLVGTLALWASLRSLRVSIRMVLGVAILLRVLLLPVGPTLSNDGYRYLWDGALTVSGQNPYVETPRQSVEGGFEPPVPLEWLNSPDYHSVYPPVSQAVFALAVFLGGSVGMAWIVLKLIVVGVELVGMWRLSQRVRPSSLAWYAWHPVAVVEIAGQGHTEGLAIGFLSLALAALLERRERLSGLWLAFAGWVKLWPFGLSVFGRGVWRAMVPVAIVLLVPWIWRVDLHGTAESLSLYGGTFDFYSAPYLLLKATLWPLVGERAGTFAALLLGVCTLLAFAKIASLRLEPPHAWAAATCSFVLLSPTLHPWHLVPALWASTFLGPRWRSPIVWLVSWAPVTYLVYVEMEWAMTAALFVGWGGAVVLVLAASRGGALLQWLLHRRGRAKWHRVRSMLGPESHRILDVGAAEGYVGLAAAEDGQDVVLSDLFDDRRVALPFVLASERSIPLEDDAADAVLLVFVLHHAEAPEAVLAEAKRLAKRVVVWETVPRRWAPKPLLQLMDTIVNAARSTEMRRASLRTVQAWEHSFLTTGFEIQERSTWGIAHPQALWVLRRSEDAVDRRISG